MQSFETTGRVEGGKLKIRNRQQMESVVGSWRDCDLTIRIEKAHATRSHAANAYYWGVIVELFSEHTGYTPQECHEFLKARFLPKKLAVTGRNGEIVDEHVVGGTTSTLNKIEFVEYITQIREWLLLELDIDTPNPDPNYRDTSEQQVSA